METGETVSQRLSADTTQWGPGREALYVCVMVTHSIVTLNEFKNEVPFCFRNQ